MACPSVFVFFNKRTGLSRKRKFTTGVVIFAVFAFAAYFAVVDTLVGRGIQKLFDTFTK